MILHPPKPLITIGWKEWCALPDLYLPAIKAKIDTGAKTSTLHATNIRVLQQEGVDYVEFLADPVQHMPNIKRRCVARLADQRYIMNSTGHREKRCVIKTQLVLGSLAWEVEVTLTDRELLSYRMLIGRDAIRGHVMINPAKTHCQGRLSSRALRNLYFTSGG